MGFIVAISLREMGLRLAAARRLLWLSHQRIPTDDVTLLYNLIMAGVDLAALFRAGRERNPSAWAFRVLGAGAVALMLAIALGEDRFGMARLAAYGLFLHGGMVMVGSAVVWWRRRRTLAVGSAVVALLLAAVAVDAFLIEPTWLEVTEIRIRSAKIDRPIRIVVLADLQTDRIGPYQRDVFRRISQAKPDLVLLAGDYVQTTCEERLGEVQGELATLLREIDFGRDVPVFAVRGNIEPTNWADVFAGLEIEVVHSTRSFVLGGLRLTCLSLRDSYEPSLTVSREDRDRFHLVLGHVPNFALGRIDADLLVAGHTHGGQVRLPWIGPLTTNSQVPRRWGAGLTDLPGGGRLLVSRGVGMEGKYAPRMRFCCRPELVVIDLVPAGE